MSISKLGDDEFGKSPSIIVSQRGGFNYSVGITQNFGDGHLFDDVIALLDNATELDSITFNINSRGGNLFSLIALQNAISTTLAEFHMVLLGEASSAAGALFLTNGASSYRIGKNTMLMIHSVQAGSGYGAASEIKLRSDINSSLNERYVESSYSNFLTDAEIHDVVFNNREIYMFDDEIKDRLSARIACQNQEIEELAEGDDFSFDGVSDEELNLELYSILDEMKKRKNTEMSI